MTSHGALMMIGVITTQLQSSLREQLIYYQLSDMSSLAKDEMENSHWSDDLIEVKTKAYTISRFPDLAGIFPMQQGASFGSSRPSLS